MGFRVQKFDSVVLPNLVAYCTHQRHSPNAMPNHFGQDHNPIKPKRLP